MPRGGQTPNAIVEVPVPFPADLLRMIDALAREDAAAGLGEGFTAAHWIRRAATRELSRIRDERGANVRRRESDPDMLRARAAANARRRRAKRRGEPL